MSKIPNIIFKLFSFSISISISISIINTSAFADKKEKYPKPEYDLRLDQSKYGRVWYKIADTDYLSAYNIGVYYRQTIKDYKLAEFWYKKSWNIKKDKDTANNLGYLYDETKQYDKAIKWYKLAIERESSGAMNNLALLYDNQKKYKLAIKYYKMAIKKESLDAMKNFSLLNYNQFKDYTKAVEYMLPLIDKKYTKKKVFALFRRHWKFDEEIIKKGYEAQLKSKIIPEKLKYKGGLE